MDMIFIVFSLILNSSLQASIVALPIIALKSFFSNIINARIHYILWFLILIRLLIPFFPESDLSLFNIFQTQILDTESDFEKTISIHTINGKLDQKEFYENQYFDTHNKINENNLMKQSKKINVMSLKIISSIWFIGFLFMILLILKSIVRIKSKTKYFNKVVDRNILTIFDKCKEKLEIQKEISIYTGNYFESPCIFGIFNPCIYYPQNMLAETNNKELYHVLLHELAHYKRKDHFGNLLGLLALSIHWFNPIVWICIKRMRQDRELACDSYVLEVIGEKEAISYGNTIIEFLKHFSLSKKQSNLLIFYKPNNQFERRIKMIKNFKKGSYKISIASIIFFIIIGTFILTNAVTGENDKNLIPQNNSIKTMNKITKSIYKDKLIIIDPAHGEHDPGSINTKLELKEKDIVLDVALRLRKLLENTGFKVYITREDDKYITLQERADMANKLKADAFLSIHVFADSNISEEGVHVSYSPKENIDSKTFASITKNSLVQDLNTTDKGIIEKPNLVVLKNTQMPAISLSLGYLTNPREGELFGQDEYKQNCAESIHNGLIEYFNKVLTK
ncbi:M56 family metallopeptidase [Maledivibacter halophilus]|uniref:Bla regulator protein blaR1 n=1 Tax=Maledivibacter halophilus TaxID=36842 RepID=A0A1T5M9X6_9FIRM|nr:M56 family metallopeptidase [Maledivibacter halophilus]SKC84945.1 bla regulator protein blaR1 [Maledivibacter halophilus]